MTLGEFRYLTQNMPNSCVFFIGDVAVKGAAADQGMATIHFFTAQPLRKCVDLIDEREKRAREKEKWMAERKES